MRKHANALLINVVGFSDSNLRFSMFFLGVGDGYAVLDSSSKYHSSKAQIYSKFIAWPACLKFFFYLHGARTGYLRIKIKTRSNSVRVVFLRYGSHGDKWNVGQVYLDFRDYQVTKICPTR